MIEVAHLEKHYQVHKRAPGLGAAFRSLFHREYETVKAVDDITFTIQPGERVGFLGPNGAGKTTTMKMLSGLLHPSAGTARVLGFTPHQRHPDFLGQITLVMGQKQQLLWDLPPSETFAINQALYQLPDAQFKETLDELVRLLDLSELIKKPTRQLSLGERMKCELAAALLHRPKVLFLDEPTIGLDVSMQAIVRQFIRDYNERFNATILLTSHYMDDVAALCPRVIVINEGRLIYDGPLAELVHQVRPEKRITLKLRSAVDAAALVGLGTVVKHEGVQVTLQVGQDRLQAVVGQAMAQLPVADLTVEDAPLEEVMGELFARHAPAKAGTQSEPKPEAA
jgi:ABC-2 type transport system ATP-binding protein